MENDFGTFTDTETIRFIRVLPGTLEQVWACLTEAEHKAKWLAGGNVEPKEGGKVTHHFNHQNLSNERESLPEKYCNIGEESTSYGRVLKYEPFTLLSYTWEEGNNEVSEVVFELSKKSENKVLLVLTHTKIPESKNFKIGLAAGWHTHLNILYDFMEGNSPKGFWKVHMSLEEEYKRIV